MKFVISSSELLQVVQNLVKVISSKPAQPILDNFLFNLSEDALEITASDSELTLRAAIQVENCIEPGMMAVPAKHMLDFLKEFPDQPLTIGTLNDSSYECSWASGASTLPYFPAEDYPNIPELEKEEIKSLDFPAQVLLDGINKTVYATGDDDIRPVMNGIFFDINNNETILVASDTHKLICYNTVEAKYNEAISFILHKKTAGIMKTIIGKQVENVNISFDSKHAKFQIDNITVLTRLIVGKYPKYKEVIPYANENKLIINRVQFLNVVRRVAVFVDKASGTIKLDLNNNILEVSAQDVGFSISGYDKLTCQYDGEPLKIGFNYSFLIEILSNLDYENIEIKFGNSQRAVLINPAEDEEGDKNVCGILIPNMI